MLYIDPGIYHYRTCLYQLIFESYQSKEEECSHVPMRRWKKEKEME